MRRQACSPQEDPGTLYLFPSWFFRPIAPFLVGAKLPSMKHSCQSRRPCWSSWKMNARHRLSHTSSSSQSLSRLQQVAELGRCAGMPPRLAAVFNIRRMPSSTSRSEYRGRPNEPRSGRSGLIRSQQVGHEFVAHAFRSYARPSTVQAQIKLLKPLLF